MRESTFPMGYHAAGTAGRRPMTYNFTTFDRRSARRALSTPELTIQSKGAISMNAAAYEAMGSPGAVELLFDDAQRVMGLRKVGDSTPHAYPIRPIGKGATYVLSAKAFFAFHDLPLGEPVRRVVTIEDDVLIVDLKDPGRVAISNRNRAKTRIAESNGRVDPSTDSRTAESEEHRTVPSDALAANPGS